MYQNRGFFYIGADMSPVFIWKTEVGDGRREYANLGNTIERILTETGAGACGGGSAPIWEQSALVHKDGNMVLVRMDEKLPASCMEVE